MNTSICTIVRAGQQWSANGDSAMGAALAYYALFSIAPLLVIAISIAGVVYGDEAAQGEVKRTLSNYIDRDSAGAIESLVENAGKSGGAIWARILSVGVLLFAALGAFVQLRTSLQLIWKLPPPRLNTFLAILLDYGFALLMVLCTGVLLLGSLAFGVVLSFVRVHIDDWFPDWNLPWEWVDFVVSLVFLTLLFGAIYWVLAGRRISWRSVVYGAVCSSVLFTLGKILLSYYIVYAGMASAYGAAGSLVVFLMWIYYSAQILFFGAEMIQARRTRSQWLASEMSKPGA